MGAERSRVPAPRSNLTEGSNRTSQSVDAAAAADAGHGVRLQVATVSTLMLNAAARIHGSGEMRLMSRLIMNQRLNTA
jgi:hypothetical protein